jgi:hypothetical protein
MVDFQKFSTFDCLDCLVSLHSSSTFLIVSAAGQACCSLVDADNNLCLEELRQNEHL